MNNYQIRHFGCDCGAYDCPICHPEEQEIITCSHCGKEMMRWEGYKTTYGTDEEYLCDECRDINYCPECGEYTWDEVCPECETETVEAYN